MWKRPFIRSSKTYIVSKYKRVSNSNSSTGHRLINRVNEHLLKLNLIMSGCIAPEILRGKAGMGNPSLKDKDNVV
jgi:hypothetical protein